MRLGRYCGHYSFPRLRLTLKLTRLGRYCLPGGRNGFTGRQYPADGQRDPSARKGRATTGRDSIAIVKLSDGTRMTIRPNSVFRIDQYSQKSGSETFLLSMFKGGLRAITGLISKRNPDAFTLRTPVATVGIRGTDFSARICTDDCATEAERVAGGQASSPKENAVARLAFGKGVLTATSTDGKERVVHLGGAIYEGDILAYWRRCICGPGIPRRKSDYPAGQHAFSDTATCVYREQTRRSRGPDALVSGWDSGGLGPHIESSTGIPTK